MMIDTSAIVSALPSGAAGRAPAALQAADRFQEVLRAAEQAGVNAVLGGGDPHEMVTRMAEARLTVEMVTAVRDRAVEAYQEILRMPV